MPRTTTELVGGIIEVDDDIDVAPFIDTASQLVEELCVPAAYSDERLELIERWLAAHFYAIRDNRRSSESIRGIQETFQFRVDLNLNATMYGQQVQLLDTALTLAVLQHKIETGNPKRVGMFHLSEPRAT